jgi:hypothetical protein
VAQAVFPVGGSADERSSLRRVSCTAAPVLTGTAHPVQLKDTLTASQDDSAGRGPLVNEQPRARFGTLASWPTCSVRALCAVSRIQTSR